MALLRVRGGPSPCPLRTRVSRRTQPPPRGEPSAENVPCLQRNRAGTATSGAGAATGRRRGAGQNASMRCEQVIATHGNTDFDALAAAVAASKLYPGAVVCLTGSLNRNVREFHRLHADELPTVEAARLELDAIRRLVVVETVHASRLGELERVALDPAVEKVVFDHHGERAAGLGRAGERDPVRGRRADDHARRDPRRARAPGDADRGDAVRARDPRGHRLAHLPDRDAARRRRARLVPPPRRRPAPGRDVPAHAARRRRARPADGRCSTGSRRSRSAGVEVLVAAVEWPRYVDGISNLAHKVVDLTDARALVLLVAMDGRVFCVTRSRSPELDAAAVAEALGGGGHEQAASAIFRGPLEEARRVAVEALPGARREPVRAARRSCRARPVRSRPTWRSPRRWCSASATPRAGSSSPRTGAPSASPSARISTRRSRTASRTRR